MRVLPEVVRARMKASVADVSTCATSDNAPFKRLFQGELPVCSAPIYGANGECQFKGDCTYGFVGGQTYKSCKKQTNGAKIPSI
jgi:hypothetical protein